MEKLQKFLQQISHSGTYTCFAHPIDFLFLSFFLSFFFLFFFLTNFEKLRIYQVRFLFGMSPGVDSYSHHFGTINKQQNGEQNLSWNVYY